jgi:hypothetical protein
MRLATSLTLPFVLVLLACGGNVIVDGSAPSGTGGASTTTATGGAGAGACAKGVCPMYVPAGGQPCPCFGMTCPYDQCPEDGSLMTATCDNGSWSIQVAECTSATQCGATQCTPGFVCAHRIGGPVTNMPVRCIPNPCGASPLACSCATTVCPTGADTVCEVMDNDLFCGCPTCK